MTEIRPSRLDEIPRQKALWKLAFGDDDRYIDYFYDYCAGPEDMMVLLEDGVLASMLALLPVTVALPDGTKAKGSYIYALATDPAARKKGFGRQLLHYVDFYLRDRGMDCVVVVPAEVSLHKFFGTVGFSECFSNRKIELLRSMVEPPTPGDRIAPVSTEDYIEVRERQLKEQFHIAYDEDLINYQRGVSEMTGGDLFRITIDGDVGCAAAEYYDEDSVLLKELVLAPEQMARAVAQIATVLPGARYHVRTPALWAGLPGSYIQAFAMMKWFHQEQRLAWQNEKKGYMGLGFD